MKCPHCGNPLNLEDAFCPFCGQPNTLAQKHQADMKRYENEFIKTQQDVYKNTHRFTKLTIPIIILFVLLLLNVGALFFSAKSWDIGSSLLEHKINTNKELHQANIDQLIANKDYYGLSAYYDQNSLYLAECFDEYRAVTSAANSYYYLLQNLIFCQDENSYLLEEEFFDDTIDSIARNLENIFNTEQEYDYNKELYLSDDKLAIIEDISSQTKALLVSYAGLTPEEAEELPNLSTARKAELLERRLSE